MSERDAGGLQFGELAACLRALELRVRQLERAQRSGGSLRVGSFVLSVDGSGNLIATSTVAPFTVTTLALP